MEIAVKKLKNGYFSLEIDAVSLDFEPEVMKVLYQTIDKHLHRRNEQDEQAIQKKLQVYRALANTMTQANDRVLQSFLPKLTPEQLVTLVRLSDEQRLYQKVLKNMSKTNQRQFEEDFQMLDKITVHQALVRMEQIIPLIKEAVAWQKKIEQETSSS